QDGNKQHRYAFLLTLLVGGVALDLLGSWLMRVLQLPLYFDCVGIILAAALGGYLPGIIVGYISNLINGINDPTNMYYAFTSVLIAFCAAYFAKNGWFKKIGGCIKAILVFTLIGGGIGSIISWLLFGFDVSGVASTPFSRALVERGVMSAFWAHFLLDMLLDLIDKTLHMIVVFIILKLIPERVQERFLFHGWQQRPLSDDERHTMQRMTTRAMSLRSRIILLIGVAAIFMACATAGISFLLYHRATIEDHSRIGQGISALAAGMIDGDRVDDFVTMGESAPGYREVKEQLELIREGSPDVKYLYVYQIRDDGCHVVFDLDTEELKGEDPGTVIPFEESFGKYVPALLAGEEIEPIITDERYGWLLTSYTPVHDSSGKTVCYAAADIDMGDVRTGEISFITRVVTLFSGFFLIILAIGRWVAVYYLILPINTMTDGADEFAYNTEKARDESVEKFKDLQIRTGDEIENLYNSFAATMASAVSYFDESQKKTASLTRMQNGLILVLADLVESRDKCTGDHVRKTAAYARIILRQMAEDGVYPDKVTEEFIENVANSAPLHDVGKIAVPDAILNKPGKLTDEEFEIMKRHTVAGSAVINKAIELVSDSGYLKEAKNLAASHHEKWNGSGYPYGLKGEDIPLSARVMAVADVFDALVSRRSYKEPFSFEKAVSIIEEGAGSHFDPQIVESFKHALPQAREIYETNMEEGGIRL
ncbi:MAG: HD domain-containing protein, partial [Lachnospiraceae bacterium]|nr:HD domain-containing protein [Lachnospiraceae bacterium]